MKAQLATVALVSLMPWSSIAAPAKTELRGCRAGYAFNSTSNLCELCPSGTFTDAYNWESSCQPCTPCSAGRQLVAACNASSNTVCRCADDHYEHEDGCSPKTGTTRSGIEELDPILQGIKKQIAIEAQKTQDKIGNLTIAVIVVIVVVVLLVVSAMLITQRYPKLVDFCRSQRCFGRGSSGTKDQKDGKPNEPLDDSPGRDRGSPSGQQKGASGGADIDIRGTGQRALAMADSDELPATSISKSNTSRVDVPSKDMHRNRRQEEVDLHRNPNEETPLAQDNERNCP